MKKNLYIFIIIAFLFFVQRVFTSFSITEIYPNTDNDTKEEYIEITYDGNGDNNLNGYVLYDKIGKEYVFGNDIYVNGESKKYYRPDTKILLNNSDEEIYFKNSSGEVIDSFSYTTTELGKIYKKVELENELIDENTQNQNLEENTSSENEINTETSTGTSVENEILEDLENETSTGLIDENTETSSGNTQETFTGTIINNTETGTGEIKEEKINFVIKNTFQTPTYLTDRDRELEDNRTYNCDRTKDDCRVNFDFSNSFGTTIKENDFNCIIDFGLGGLTGEENKCNPNTIIFPVGTYSLKIKIINKINSNYFGVFDFKIINDGKINSNINSSTTSKIYENISKPNKLNLKNPIIEVQGGLEKNNICNKKECSINFIHEPIYDDITCLWNFGSGIFDSNTNNKCNPSYVYFSSGKHIISLEICDKNYESNCKKSEFIFENEYKYLEPKAIITLQGKLSKNKTLDNDKITCIGAENCSINFTGEESIGTELSYFWDFGDNTFFEGKNPSSHIFEKGTYDVVLQINDNLSGFSEIFFNVEVKGKEELIIDAKEEENIIENKNNLGSIETEKAINIKIDLQGKQGTNKVLENNKLTCIKTCSVNLDGSKSVGDFESYFWDFGNGETYTGKNPPYISYKDFGNYTILFSLEDKEGNIYEKEFFINYIKSQEKIEKKENNLKKEENLEVNPEYNIEEKDEEIVGEELDIYDENIPISKPITVGIIIIILFASFILFKRYKII